MNLALAKAADRVVGRFLAGCLAVGDGLAALGRPPAPPLEEITTLLVVKFWGVGNWALLRPIVFDLRARWPRARVLLATLEGNRPLVEDLADELLLLRPRGLLRLGADFAGAVSAVRRARPEVSVDFEQFASAGTLLARAGGVAQRIGFASGSRGRDGLLTATVPWRHDAHASRSFRDLAEVAGVAPGPYRAGGLTVSERARDQARAALKATGLGEGGPWVVLHPGSGDNFPGRRWSPAGFAAVGRLAAERHGARVVVTGTAGEAALARQVAQGVGPRGASLAGRLTLEGLVGVLGAASVLVSNDTGPVHLASALDRPVLALFGPNTPRLYGPLSPRSRVFYEALPCSPCLTTENYRSSRCRLHTCMAAIPTGEVAGALDRLLRATHDEVVAWRA